MSKQIKTSVPEFCVDIPGANCTNNVQAISYKCHQGPNQRFRYNRRTKQIRSLATRKCLTARKGRVVQSKINIAKMAKNQERTMEKPGRQKMHGRRRRTFPEWTHNIVFLSQWTEPKIHINNRIDRDQYYLYFYADNIIQQSGLKPTRRLSTSEVSVSWRI
jgi:hypothetical protein